MTMVVFFMCSEILFNQTLCSKRRLYGIITWSFLFQKQTFYQFIIITKYFPQNIFCSKWFCITCIIEPDSFAVELVNVYRNGRNKMPHDTFYCIHGYAPDTEETKDMINAE